MSANGKDGGEIRRKNIGGGDVVDRFVGRKGKGRTKGGGIYSATDQVKAIDLSL